MSSVFLSLLLTSQDTIMGTCWNRCGKHRRTGQGVAVVPSPPPQNGKPRKLGQIYHKIRYVLVISFQYVTQIRQTFKCPPPPSGRYQAEYKGTKEWSMKEHVDRESPPPGRPSLRVRFIFRKITNFCKKYEDIEKDKVLLQKTRGCRNSSELKTSTSSISLYSSVIRRRGFPELPSRLLGKSPHKCHPNFSCIEYG